jgi:exodeoxyribonuclease VII large subunit
MTILESTEITYTISELSQYIKAFIPNKKIKVNGEISQISIRGGHIYFTLKDDNANLKAIIWKSKNINKENIVEGSEVILEGKLDYYGTNSTVNLIVDKVINNIGVGELYKKYEILKQEFANKGYFDIIHKKKLPVLLKNILLITSESGAALQDFKINLTNNKCKINYDIANVMVQGIDCPKNICSLLCDMKNTNDYYDLVVIMRGGGSFEDLFGFSQAELIEAVHTFHLPVLSAIGHQVDNPLLDLVADISCATPSLAAQYIIDHNKKYLNDILTIKNTIKIDILDTLTNNKKILTNLNNKINNYKNILAKLKNECQNILINDINSLIYKYSHLEGKLLTEKNINLYYNDTKINNPLELDKLLGNIIELTWQGKKYQVKLMG